jgi:hypothetical protein
MLLLSTKEMELLTVKDDTGKLESVSNDGKLEFSKIVKIVGNAES